MKNLREAWSYPTARRCLRIEFVSAAFFGMPIMATYYYDHGLSPFEVYVLQSTIALTAIASEIPTGFASDRFGAKFAIVTGFVGHTVTWTYFATCRELWQFILAVTWSSVFTCLISSSASALVLTLHGRQVSAIYDATAVQFATAGRLTGIVGGMALVATGGMYAPFIAQPFVSAVAAVLALKLPRPSVKTRLERGWLKTWNLFTEMTLRRPAVRHTIVFHVTLYSTVYGVFWIFQLQLEAVGWKRSEFGIFYVLINLGAIGITLITSQLGKWSAFSQMLALAGACCAFLLLAGTAEGQVQLWLAGSAYCIIAALLWPLVLLQLRKLMHETTLPATQQSVVSACASVAFACVSPVIGWVVQSASVRVAYLGLALFIACGCGGSLWLLRRNTSGE